MQTYTKSPENIKVENGKLVLTAVPKGIQVVNGVAQQTYTSAQINTRYKLDFKYGRFETRMKLLNASGFQPSFYLYPTYEVYGKWPNSGQIIPMTMVGNQANAVVGTTYYGQYLNNNPPQATSTYTLPGNTDFASSYHVYACEWDEYEIRFYVDGYQYFKQTLPSTSGSKPAWYSVGYPQPAPFDQVFSLYFNLAVGGDWAGNPIVDSTQSVYIDYIRVYQNSTQNRTAVPERSPTAAAAADSGFTTTTMLAVIIVGVILIVALVALRYLYAYILRKRALSDAPLPDPSMMNEHGGDKFSKIQNADERRGGDSENDTSMMEEGTMYDDAVVAEAAPIVIETASAPPTKMPIQSSQTRPADAAAASNSSLKGIMKKSVDRARRPSTNNISRSQHSEPSSARSVNSSRTLIR